MKSSARAQCATVERQKSVSTQKKGVCEEYAKQKVLAYTFISALSHTIKWFPFHKHNRQSNCLYPWRALVTLAAHFKTINTKSELTRKERNQVRSSLHSQISLLHTNTSLSGIHLQNAVIPLTKKRLSNILAFWLFGLSQMLQRLLQGNVLGMPKSCWNPGWLSGHSLKVGINHKRVATLFTSCRRDQCCTNHVVFQKQNRDMLTRWPETYLVKLNCRELAPTSTVLCFEKKPSTF